ncbi:hypothetical protein [Parafrankia discariae]|uniref:hypothetical protein n=1 Tax=Parafrankia discariae TaxID=365528 RepID=UPI00036706BE|nr:hypothetical protein [Parafrankia discariae]
MTARRAVVAAVTGILLALATLMLPSPASAAPKSPDPRYAVVASWTASTGDTVYLRQGSWNGTNGWGYAKVTAYHNLNEAAVRATTLYPKVVRELGPTTRRFETPVQHVSCRGKWIFRSCKVTETVTVMVAVDFRRFKQGGGSFGVVTAFCDGYTPKCPDWVKDAVNI